MPTEQKVWTCSRDVIAASSAYGNGTCNHVMAGSENSSSINRKSALLFTASFPARWTSVASAYLHLHGAGAEAGHDTPTTGYPYDIRRLTASFTEGNVGGDNPAYYGSNATRWDNFPGSDSTNKVSDTYETGAYNSPDMTAMVNSMISAGVYGVALIGTRTGTDDNGLWFSRHKVGYEPELRVTFNTNSLPTATFKSHGGSTQEGAVLAGTQPALVWTYGDADSDAGTEYTIQIALDSGFTSLVSLPNSGVVVGAIAAGADVTYTPPALNPGDPYYWRVKAKDSEYNTAWSATKSFWLNNPPILEGYTPGHGAVGRPSYSGGVVKPLIEWGYRDIDGHGQVAYQVKILNDTGSATVPGTTPLWNPGKIGSTGSPNNAQSVVADVSATNGQYMWVKVRAWDALDQPTMSDTDWNLNTMASGYQRFRMRWGVAVYRKDLLGDPTAWDQPVLSQSVGASQAIVVEWGSDAATTSPPASPGSGWKSAFSDVPRYRQLYYRVWMFAWGSASPGTPTHSEASIRYTNAAAVWVDSWARTNTSLVTMEKGDKFYGTQCIKVVADGVNSVFASQSISVRAGQVYTVQFRMKTSGAAHAYSDCGGVGTSPVTATSDGWKQYTYSFTASGDTASLALACAPSGTSGAYALFDAVKVEEGPVATTWSPAQVGSAAIVDAGGVLVDQSNQGSFRLIGGSFLTDSRAIVDLGTKGLVFGGDTEVSSPGTGMIRISKGGGTTSGVDFPAQTNDPGYIKHIESSNTAEMQFSASDDRGSGDYFSFGSTPSSAWSEALRIRTDGALEFSGTALERDTNLYRASPNVLKTDDNLESASAIIAYGYLQSVGNVYVANNVHWGPSNDWDINLYRGGANVLKTDDDLHVGGVLNLIQAGLESTTTSNEAYKDIAVTFSPAFAATPRVVACVTTATSLWYAVAHTVSASGFTLRIVQKDGTTRSDTIAASWIATKTTQ